MPSATVSYGPATPLRDSNRSTEATPTASVAPQESAAASPASSTSDPLGATTCTAGGVTSGGAVVKRQVGPVVDSAPSLATAYHSYPDPAESPGHVRLAVDPDGTPPTVPMS